STRRAENRKSSRPPSSASSRLRTSASRSRAVRRRMPGSAVISRTSPTRNDSPLRWPSTRPTNAARSKASSPSSSSAGATPRRSPRSPTLCSSRSRSPMVSSAPGAAPDAPAHAAVSFIMPRAAGSFDVKLDPLPFGAGVDDPMFGRRSIDKRYHGDLDATGVGQMLSAGTSVQGSAGYVAIERVSGQLAGLAGTMRIIIAGGKHSYEFDYMLGAAGPT